MDNLCFVIIRPGLERKIFSNPVQRIGLNAEGSHTNSPVQTLKSELIQGYKSAELGLISSSVLSFYKGRGFNWRTTKRSELGLQLSVLRPIVLNDSFENFASKGEEYNSDKRDILILTYNPRAEIRGSIEQKYSLIPLFNGEIIRIGLPLSADELIKEYTNNEIPIASLPDLAESYKRLSSFEGFVNKHLVDIGEIPLHISTRA